MLSALEIYYNRMHVYKVSQITNNREKTTFLDTKD